MKNSGVLHLHMRHLLGCMIFVLSIGATQAVSAQESASELYATGIQLVNLADAPNACRFTLVDAEGEAVGALIDEVIPAGGFQTFFPLPLDPDAPQSLMVACDLSYSAIANLMTVENGAGASYGLPVAGASTVDLPLLQNGNSGFESWVLIQNLGSEEADVTASYSDGVIASLSIPARASGTLFQRSEDHAAKVFSGTLTSTQPIRAAVFQESSEILFAYAGMARPEIMNASDPAGTTHLVFPLVNVGSSGWVTGIQLMNTGDEVTEVTLDYAPNVGTACSETRTIEAGASVTFALAAFANGDASTCTPGDRFVGSAVVARNSTEQPLIGIVNQFSPHAKSGGTYVGFSPDQATNGVLLPLILERNGGYFTGINVMHMGGPTSEVTCTFADTPYSVSRLLQAGEVLIDIQQGKIGEGYVGAGRCIAEEGGARIVAVVNELGSGSSADQLLVYEGIPIE